MTSTIPQIVLRLVTALKPGCRRYFEINLSRRYRPYIAPIRLGLVVVCGLLLCGVLWDVGRAAIGLTESRKIRAELERVLEEDRRLVVQAQQEGIDLSDRLVKQLPAEVRLANELLEKRTFSWTAFLTGLESAISPRLAISSVRMETGSSLVHLTGTAVRLDDVTAMTVELQHHPVFRDPVLAQHRVDANGLVEFAVTLRYERGGT